MSAAGPLAGIVRALGGDLLDGGRRALIPGPGHSRGDRSVSLLIADGRLVAHSFAGDDWRDVRDDLRRRGLLPLSAEPPGGVAVSPARPERLACAAELWARGRPLAGTPAGTHLRRRAVRRAPGAALRFHPAVPAAVYAWAGPKRPALLAAITDAAGVFCGVELTYLARDGTVASVATPRKTVGGRPAGAAVRLDALGPTLLVGEGVFSCLSAAEALGLPAWALLAVGNLRRWTPPAGVRRVVIAGDRDPAGEVGALALGARLEALDVGAEVRWPPTGADWNDWAQQAGGEVGR